MEFAIIAAVIVFLIGIYLLYRYLKKKNKSKSAEGKETKPKKEKVKKPKDKKKKDKNTINLKASGVDTVDKFLYRKELKVLVLVSKVLPKGYVAFPKIGLDTILQPVGSADLYNLVASKYVDIVIFDEITMKPRVAIDIFDGSIGDEQMDIVSPEIVEAFKLAELPLVSIKVKTDYSQGELKEPIYAALGISTSADDKDDNENKTEETK